MKAIPDAKGQEGFARLLGGDVRLEEALARLEQNGWRRGAEAACAADAAENGADPADAEAPPAAEPRFRPTITDKLTGGRLPPLKPSVHPAPAKPASLQAAPAAQAAPSAAAGRQWGVARSTPPGPTPPGPTPPGWAHRQGERTGDAAQRDARERGGPGRKDALWEEAPMANDHAGAPCRDAQTGLSPSNSADAGPDDLLSSEAASAAHAAFDRLARALGGGSPGKERSLDEMTRECLRPLLKAWLDDNLPGLVERLVREEIARVARRGS